MPKSADEVIQAALLHSEYDPQKAHDYYVRTRELKGRRTGSKVIPMPKKNHVKPQSHEVPASLQKQIDHLTSRLQELQARLREVMANAKDNKKNDKKTAAEKSKDAKASEKYRDKHKAELAQKRKQEVSKSGGISSMSETEVRAAIARTRSNLHAAVAKARAAVNQSTA